MIVDAILDRKDGVRYNPSEFYDYVSHFEETGYGITRAMDGGTEEDVKRELKQYIDANNYNPAIKDYIDSVDWLVNIAEEDEKNEDEFDVYFKLVNEASSNDEVMCTISVDDFIDLLETRLQHKWNWSVLDFNESLAWQILCDELEAAGNRGKSVQEIADNFHVNGNYGPIGDYVDLSDCNSKEEEDEKIQEYLEKNEGEYIAYNPETEEIVFSLGIRL
jgi:hypothetical protein